MMTLKRQIFTGFKIEIVGWSVFYFVIDVVSVLLSRCIGLLRQCAKEIIRDMRKSQIVLGKRWK